MIDRYWIYGADTDTRGSRGVEEFQKQYLVADLTSEN